MPHDTPLLQHLRRFGLYNRWANQRLYDACAALPAAEYHAARPSFFGSLHATLNHILVGDTAWFGRFIGQPTPQITALNQILHDDLPGLRAARDVKDAEIIAFCEAMTEDRLLADIHYSNFAGQKFSEPLLPPLMHFFNHQTHHRGQAHGLLSHAGANPPSLDMIMFLREPT